MTSLKSKFATLKSLASTRAKASKYKVVNATDDIDEDEDLGPIYKYQVPQEMDCLNRCCCIIFFILCPTNIGMCILIALLQFSVITFDDIPGLGLPQPASTDPASTVPVKTQPASPTTQAAPAKVSITRVPVPDKGACDWGIKETPVTCEVCQKYYDPRPGNGNNSKGRCVWVPAQEKCFAEQWAKTKSWSFDETCSKRRLLEEQSDSISNQRLENTIDSHIDIEAVE